MEVFKRDLRWIAAGALTGAAVAFTVGMAFGTSDDTMNVQQENNYLRKLLADKQLTCQKLLAVPLVKRIMSANHI